MKLEMYSLGVNGVVWVEREEREEGIKGRRSQKTRRMELMWGSSELISV